MAIKEANRNVEEVIEKIERELQRHSEQGLDISHPVALLVEGIVSARGDDNQLRIMTEYLIPSAQTNLSERYAKMVYLGFLNSAARVVRCDYSAQRLGEYAQQLRARN